MTIRAAALVVNGLADAYAGELRQQWRSQADKACTDAHEAMTRAAEALRQANARLDAGILSAIEQAEEKAAQLSQSTLPTQIPAASPAMVDNPDWLEMNRRLTNLQAERDRLLVDRTPQHPEVQSVEVRLNDVEHRLAETHR